MHVHDKIAHKHAYYTHAYMCSHAFIYACTHIQICIHTHTHTHTHAHTHTHTHTHSDISINIDRYNIKYICIYKHFCHLPCLSILAMLFETLSQTDTVTENLNVVCQHFSNRRCTQNESLYGTWFQFQLLVLAAGLYSHTPCGMYIYLERNG